MSIFKKMSLSEGGSDLIAFLREDRPHKLPMFLAACIPPAVLIMMINADAAEKAKPPPPTVTYFESWPANRSVEESLKAIKERQKLKDAAQENMRQGYKTLGTVLGMDVDKIEREAQAEKAAKAKDDAKQAGEPK